MSIDKVEVTNSQGNLLTLMLEDISNGYVVEEIDGLDPVKATIVTSSFATMDGQQYQASSRDVRNITMKLGYAPNYSIDETIRTLRTRLYGWFTSGESVALAFYMSDGLAVNISGIVETAEQAVFAQEPVMDISILCPQPDFISDSIIQIHSTFTTTDTVAHPINYDGTVPAGLTSLSFTVATTLSEFTIYHTEPSGVLNTMLISAPLVLGDVVNICTIKGQKSITLTRASVTTSLLWAVSPQSTWIQLKPGTNQFYLHASSGSPSAVLLDYYNRYGGL
jgi:hypothetical protein